ncbi:MAG: hypothetical protein ACJ70T_01495 [Nitrososphaera sp.]
MIYPFYDHMATKTKLSTINSAIATTAFMAIMGITGAVGQQQQMVSASLIPALDDVEEKVHANAEKLRDGVVEREICPDEIFVHIAGDGYICVPKFDLFPE